MASLLHVNASFMILRKKATFQDILGKLFRKAFEESIKVMYPNKHSFLEDFKRRRCYLADLFNERGKKVKKLSLEERQYAVNKLSNLIRKEKPKVVIGVLKRVESLVKEAVCSSSEKLKFEALCFPIGKYIKSYKESLKRILLEEK